MGLRFIRNWCNVAFYLAAMYCVYMVVVNNKYTDMWVCSPLLIFAVVVDILDYKIDTGRGRNE